MAEIPDELDDRFNLLASLRWLYGLGICTAAVNLAVMAIPFMVHPWYYAIFLAVPNFFAAAIVIFVALPRLRDIQERLKGNRPPP